jgi:hypothetical protein
MTRITIQNPVLFYEDSQYGNLFETLLKERLTGQSGNIILQNDASPEETRNFYSGIIDRCPSIIDIKSLMLERMEVGTRAKKIGLYQDGLTSNLSEIDALLTGDARTPEQTLQNTLDNLTGKCNDKFIEFINVGDLAYQDIQNRHEQHKMKTRIRRIKQLPEQATYDALQLNRRFQNTADDIEAVDLARKALAASSYVIAGDCDWSSQRLINSITRERAEPDNSTMRDIAKSSDNEYEYGVPNASVAPRVAEIFAEAGAHDIRQTRYTITTTQYPRAALLIGAERKLDPQERDHDGLLETMNKIRNSMEARERVYQVDYYITEAKAPSPAP